MPGALSSKLLLAGTTWFFSVHGLDSPGLWAASYRKDFYIPGIKENVQYKNPIDGGRVHVTAEGTTCAGPILNATVNGIQALSLPSSGDLDFTYFDWTRLHSEEDAAGSGGETRVWLSFHSRNTKWFPASGAIPPIEVELFDSKGSCAKGSPLVLQDEQLRVKHVTTAQMGAQLIVHVQNYDAKLTFTLPNIIVNGKQVFGPWTLAPGQTRVLSLPTSSSLLKLSAQMIPGALWTVSLNMTGSQPRLLGWGGRMLPELFAIEAWAHSSDCPFPAVNPTAWQLMKGAGITTIFANNAKEADCNGSSVAEIVSQMAANNNSVAKVWLLPKQLDEVTHRGNVVTAVFLGDEVDGNMSNTRDPAAKLSYNSYPDLPTYQGGKTNRQIGSFAGMTDYQGMDAYVAACAPTMDNVINTLPITYPFQYLRNAQQNHAPLPSALYSQLYFHGWTYQAHDNELVMQVGQAVAAGAKALTLFESDAALFQKFKFASGPVAGTLKSVQALGEALRTGDIGGLLFNASVGIDQALVEVIRSPDKVVPHNIGLVSFPFLRSFPPLLQFLRLSWW